MKEHPRSGNQFLLIFCTQIVDNVGKLLEPKLVLFVFSFSRFTSENRPKILIPKVVAPPGLEPGTN
jgi:hypothetical protein